MRVLRVLVGLVVFFAIAAGVTRAWDFFWIDQFGNGLSVGTGGGGGKTDSTGVYVAGAVQGALPGLTGAGSNDTYVRKYTFDGQVSWTRQFGTPGTEFNEGLATDSTGVYVGGRTTGTLPGQTSAGNSDAFVRKYSPTGGLLWTTQFGTAAFDALFFGGVVVDDSFVYVAGATFGTFPGGPPGLGGDIFAAKLDAQTGALVWIRQFGRRSQVFSGVGGVAVDAGNVYVVSNQMSGFAIGDPDIGLIHTYDLNGNLLATREFPGTVGCSAALFGVAARDGAFYVVAQASEEFLGDGRPCKPAASEVVGLVQKYTADGTAVWSRRIKAGSRSGRDGFTGAKTVWVSDSGVYVAANATRPFPGSVNNVPRSDRSVCPGLQNGNGFDKLTAYVRRYDVDGRVIWTHEFGSNVFDLATGVGTNATSVFVVGDTSCAIQDEELFSGGFRDTFVLRMAITPISTAGNIQLLVGRLETLNDTQRLADGPFTNLVSDLETAQAALQEQNALAAEEALIAFTENVQAFVTEGALPASDGALLISDANAIISQL